MTVEPNGTRIWINENDQLHSEDGPAVILPDGEKRWYKNGQLHREDGPAVIEPDGTIEWWLNSTVYSFTKWANELNLDTKTRLEMVMKWNPE